MNNMELAGALVTSPSTAFLALKEKPRFWFPLLSVSLSTVALFVWYYSIVDIAWLQDRLLSANPSTAEMNEQQRAQAAQFMSVNFLIGSSVVSVLVATVITRALEAVYFTLAGNIVNARFTFQQWFALSCWTVLPYLIVTAAMAAYLLTADSNQIGYEEMSVLSLNELFFNKSMADPGFTLLSSLTLINPWAWWLTVMGVRAWSGRSWLFSSVFALAPILLVYGGWILWAFK